MAVVFSAVSSANGTDPTTLSHTIAAGPNRLLVVSVNSRSNVAVTTVKYGGVLLTLITNQAYQNGYGTPETALVSMYYLIAPQVGTANVVVDFASATNAVVIAHSYVNVDQDSPVGTALKTANVSNPSLGLTTEAGWLCVDALGFISDDNVASCGESAPGASQSEKDCLAVGAGGAAQGTAVSNELASGSSTTMSYTINDLLNACAYIAVPLRTATIFSVRSVEYTLDAWDPEQRILDSFGHVVPRYKIRPNEWARVVGLEHTDAAVYDSNYDDPALVYFESVKYDGETDQVEIITSRGNLPEVILARLMSGGSG